MGWSDVADAAAVVVFVGGWVWCVVHDVDPIEWAERLVRRLLGPARRPGGGGAR